MKKTHQEPLVLSINFNKAKLENLQGMLERYMIPLILVVLTAISIIAFKHYLNNGLGLAYNDARSHLDIGRRVVEGLKPGMAQLGSVWLPLPHLLMVPTIWNDYFWHTGLSGAVQSMIAYVATAILVYKICERLRVGMVGRLTAVFLFSANFNILYLQSTAMTELLLIFTMTAAVYQLIKYYQDNKIVDLIYGAFWVMLSTLARYDGWFLLFVSTVLIFIFNFKKEGYRKAEGMFVFYCTLAALGIFLWVLWNLVIFKDPLYFAFGPYSAHAQQEQLDQAGILITKGNWAISTVTYWFAMVYNSYLVQVILGAIGAAILWFDTKKTKAARFAIALLLTPLIFNILALYLGHSVLFVQNLNGNSWFNVRYGVMMVPSFAIFIGYLVDRAKVYRYLVIGLVVMVTMFSFISHDAVTIDDGMVGSSQKNVSEVSGWLKEHATNQEGFILISAASHDAIIFSSGLPMSRFIHEGTGLYWENATTAPDRWARWIIMRTNDTNDQTFRLVNLSGALYKYDKVGSYPFADIYQLKPEYLDQLQTRAVIDHQK